MKTAVFNLLRAKATTTNVSNYVYFTIAVCITAISRWPMLKHWNSIFVQLAKFQVEVKHVHTVETIWYKQNDSVFLWSAPRMFGAVKILVTYARALLIHALPLLDMRQSVMTNVVHFLMDTLNLLHLRTCARYEQKNWIFVGF